MIVQIQKQPRGEVFSFLAGPLRFSIRAANAELAQSEASARLFGLTGKWSKTQENFFTWIS